MDVSELLATTVAVNGLGFCFYHQHTGRKRSTVVSDKGLGNPTT